MHSENMMESDDLLFPIEEVVDNAAVEKLKSESGALKWKKLNFFYVLPNSHTHGSMVALFMVACSWPQISQA